MLMVHSKGTKSFYVSKRVNGKPEKIKLGTFPDMTVEMARNQARETLAAIARGENPSDAKRRYRKEMTFEQFFAAFCEDSRLQPNTIRDYKSLYRLHLTDWASKRMSDITSGDVREKHSYITKTRGTLYAANTTIRVVRRLFNAALQQEIFSGKNPALHINFNPEESRDRFLEAHELPYVMEALEDEENVRHSAFFKLLILTGIRKTNCLTLRWQHIDFHGKAIKIPKTKNGSSHTVHITPQILHILKNIPRENDWVFPGQSKNGHLNEPRKAWQRILNRACLYQLRGILLENMPWEPSTLACYKGATAEEIDAETEKLRARAIAQGISLARAGIKNVRIHDLRRTFGSVQASMGVSATVIGKLLGHKSLASTAIYTHINDQVKTDAITRLNEHVMNTAAPAWS